MGPHVTPRYLLVYVIPTLTFKFVPVESSFLGGILVEANPPLSGPSIVFNRPVTSSV